ncbi:SulP family inorganic anion transporter [Lutibacter sp. TH_r2]|uniref:SulP family inorganic anion transporter n=1 Tax=Lutibacter sp. TH_r2 TaxID=3082083 RepID=UPI0029533761|nr:SulP family inorganic anion transporter [Lutibacter sp. TH_r2]MDV7186929.1 SulP family inorganic anion transporter [Lutibacter sp. TH_r2]
MSFKKYLPFLTWLPLVKNTWKDDLIAGLTGTVVVIPMAVAFAMIAGLPPVYGFYTAMITPVIAAFFGSSYHLISGPTTTSSIVVFAIISKHVNPETELEAFISLAILISFMAGIIKLLMGIAKMGKLVNFVSNSVVIGFAAGAGILIAVKQLKHVFGIKVPLGSSFYDILKYIIYHIEETNVYVLAIALGTLIVSIFIKKFIKVLSRLHMLIAMILASVVAFLIDGSALGIQTVGYVPSNLPPFKIPDFSFDNMKMLSSGAVTLALLGLVEAVSIGRSIALHTHQKLDNNQEFIGQGLTNIISSFFSSYVSSGSFTRSSVNYQSGAKTPFSAIISAIGLMIVVLFFAEYASYLPIPAMGGIILMIGYKLIDIHHIKQIIKSSKREFIVLAVTLLGTLFFELETALFSGIMISLFFYLEKTSKPNIAIFGKNKDNNFINIIRDNSTKECPQLKIVRIDGSIYFGAVEVISNYFAELYDKGESKNLLIISNGVNFIDLAGAEWITQEALKWEKRGGGIYFVGLKIISQDILKNGGFIKTIGAHHFFKDKNTALATIYPNLDQNICKSCTVKIFEECK